MRADAGPPGHNRFIARTLAALTGGLGWGLGLTLSAASAIADTQPLAPQPGTTAVGAMAATLSVRQARANYAGHTRYIITRNGNTIGQHHVRFEPATGAAAEEVAKPGSGVSIDQGVVDEAGILVTIESSIDVKFLGLSVYTLDYESVETWKGDLLQRVSSRTNDDGKTSSTILERDDERAIATLADGTEQSLPTMVLPSNHWYAPVVQADTLFNTITGELSQVDIQAQGSQTLEFLGRAVKVTTYTYTGDLELQVWYDDAGLWHGMEFVGEDGSTIRYELDTASLNPG